MQQVIYFKSLGIYIYNFFSSQFIIKDILGEPMKDNAFLTSIGGGVENVHQ